MSESYDRAESVLDELVPTIDESVDHVSFFLTWLGCELPTRSFRQIPNTKSSAG